MPSGGTLLFETRTGHDTRKDECITLTITDSGSGMPLDGVYKAFNPYFTTHENNSYKGLGLSVAYGFVEQCSGKIPISSEEGRGTSVIINLPLAL